MIRADTLPVKLMSPCLALIRVLAHSERDLIRLIVEIIQDLRDTAYGDNEDVDTQAPVSDSHSNSCPLFTSL